jgi:hypothetical protein
MFDVSAGEWRDALRRVPLIRAYAFVLQSQSEIGFPFYFLLSKFYFLRNP